MFKTSNQGSAVPVRRYGTISAAGRRVLISRFLRPRLFTPYCSRNLQRPSLVESWLHNQHSNMRGDRGDGPIDLDPSVLLGLVAAGPR